ncbi:hypothetical protein PV325_001802 [Microctonus aethiopoides]|nr:hypothetical protein PV325_001802 [Microctonus aethiopoides]
MKQKKKQEANSPKIIMTDTLTEFEESLLFDVDDPDFASPNSQTLINTMKNNNQGIFQVDYMPNINIMSSRE